MDSSDPAQHEDTHSGRVEVRAKWLCLEFVNTLDLRLSVRDESLHNYSDLVNWSHEHEALTESETQYLLDEAQRHPRDAASHFEHVLTVREALYGVLSAATNGREPPPADLETLNAVLAATTAPIRLVATPAGFEQEWLDNKHELDWMLGPIARSAVELLTSRELSRVKECQGSPGKACGWLFVDTSKNRSRQWCVSGQCGNRARVQRHYARKRTASTAESDGGSG